MNEIFSKLKAEITLLSSNPNFIHHQWFIKWHLELVERISLELLEKYTNAEKDIVLGLVWMHDYAKIIDYDNEHNPEVVDKGKIVLKDLGFEESYIEKLFDYIHIFESKMATDLAQAPIEVQIVSSADAASHMTGPFFHLHWYEHPEKSVEELLESNLKKLSKDWDRKIVLPEVKEKFKERYEFLREQFGILPPKYNN